MSFDSTDQAITRLASRAGHPDVTNITPERLAQAVAGKLLGPIDLDYIPNLKKDDLARTAKPLLRRGIALYGALYHLCHRDRLAGRQDFPRHRQAGEPWSIFWQSQKHKGYVGVLDDSREALVLGMLCRSGHHSRLPRSSMPISAS